MVRVEAGEGVVGGGGGGGGRLLLRALVQRAQPVDRRLCRLKQPIQSVGRLGEHAEAYAQVHEREARGLSHAQAWARRSAPKRDRDGQLLQPRQVRLQQVVRRSDELVLLLGRDDREHRRLDEPADGLMVLGDEREALGESRRDVKR